MDIELYGRVIWRHKVVVGIGLVLALLLASLSYFKVGAKGIAYRDSEQWVSYETLSVTQPGFMEGRLDASGADPSRLTLLAVLYSKYVDADPVHRAIWPNGPHHESIEAAPVFSPTGRGAQLLAARTTDALMRYIANRQEQAHVPTGQRVELQPVKRALSNKPVLWQGRSKALPIVIFLPALIAAIGLAFILENLSPQIAAVTDAEEENLRRVIGRPRAS